MSSKRSEGSSWPSLGLVVALLVAAIGCGPKARAPLDYVDPNIGGIGYLLQPAQPHVQMPHGMARLAPITTPLVKDRYLADKLYGFRAGVSTIMPTTGALEKDPARFASLYDHDLEKVTPYSYEALLESYDVKVEYAPTATGAYYRFTFPKDTDPHVVFSMTRNPEVDVRAPNVVAGAEDTPFGGKVYFYATFSQPFVAQRTWKEEASGAAVDFARRGEPTQIDVKVGFSLIGTEQARANIEREMPEWNLDAVRAGTRSLGAGVRQGRGQRRD